MNLINRTSLTLSYIICAIAIAHICMISVQLDFTFTPAQMTHPAMVIAFVTANVLNITRIKEVSASINIIRMSVFANALTMCLALGFTLQDPQIPKVVTTSLMTIVTLLSIISLAGSSKRARRQPS